MSNVLKKLQEQEGELESRLVGKPEEIESKETGESLETQDTEATNQGNEEHLQTPEEHPSTETTETASDDPAEKLAALDKRFRNYKASTDKTIHSLRQERKGILSDLADSLEEVERLKSELQKSFDNSDIDMPFTEEDEKIVGPEALEIMKRAYKAQAKKSSEAELRKEQKERKERISTVKQMAKETEDESPLDRFARELELLAPDWKEYVGNKAFKEFLETKDPRGLTWKKRWMAAERAGTPELILDILEAYDKPRKKANQRASLDETGSPSQMRPSGDKGEKTVWTPAKIAEFHKKQQSGHYRKSPELMKEGSRIEKEIDEFVKAQFGG